jgi:hypothetical protein
VRQQSLVVLKVSIHNSDVRRSASEDSLDAGGSQSAAANPLNAPDAAVVISKPADSFWRSILGVVVDEDRFPIDALQREA